jgi:electron transport complex protein RnfD
MTAWAFPDAVAGATPLVLLQGGELRNLPDLWQMFLGVRGGALGETSALALLTGGAYLLIRRVISWHAPAAFLSTVFLLTLILGKQPLYQLMSGGLLLGAFFMATDYSTTPITNSGRLIFGAGCGFITVLIRVWGNYPEGVSFSILMMNILTPYISAFTRPRPLGGAKT